MDERNPMTAMARPKPSGTGPADAEEDPLVELARIVSGRSGPDEPRRRSVFQESTVTSEADLARDLEAELLSDLQATFAAAGDEEDEFGEPADDPPFHAAEDLDPPQEADAFPFERDEAPPPPLDPYEDNFDDDAAYAQFVDDPFGDPADGDLEPDFGAPPPEPEDVQERYEEVPPPPPAAAFQAMALRANRGGPAFNPNALAGEAAPRAQRPAVPESQPAAAPEPVPQPPAMEDRGPAGDWYTEHDPGLAQPDAEIEPAPEAYGNAAYAEAAYSDQPELAPEAAAVAPPKPRHRDPRLERDPTGEARYASRRSNSRRFYAMVAVLAIVVVGIAAIFMLGGGGTTDGDPPLIAADTSPTRVFPEQEANAGAAGNVVFDRVNPDQAAPQQETLLDGAEPVADLTVDPEANDGITQMLAQTDNGAAGDAPAPRMVRTVTVLPDGTIVDTNTAPANGEEAAETPVSGVAGETPAAETPVAPEAVAETPAEATPAPELETPEVAPQAANNAGVPRVGDPIATGFYVQVSAQGSEAGAQTQLADYRAAAPGLLGNQAAVIERAELANGTFFRLQFGPFASQTAAEQFRSSLANIGIDSFLTTH